MTSSWFCFNNHFKIRLTDKMAYVGTQNFLEGIKNNFEAGFITEDIDTISGILRYLESIIDESLNYYVEDILLLFVGYLNSIIDDIDFVDKDKVKPFKEHTDKK